MMAIEDEIPKSNIEMFEMNFWFTAIRSKLAFGGVRL